jgi:hypothetical protein
MALGATLPLEAHSSEEMIAELGGPSYRAGCSFDTASWQLAVEIHAAAPEEHSLIWSPPRTEAAREAQRVDGVGDEAYVGEWSEGGANVTARKGLVEVYLYQRQQDEHAGPAPFTAEQLLTATASLLERWPSGPGAAPTPAQNVPDIPLPPDVTAADVSHFDPADPQFEGIFDDEPDVVEFFSFADAVGDSEAYCAVLRSHGYTDDAAWEGGSSTCTVVGRRWLVEVRGDGETFGALILAR